LGANDLVVKKIIERINSPTPKWFKGIRNVGVTLAAVSAALLAAPVALPAIVITVAGYVATAGAVAVAVSETAVNHEN
jgi:hypothetical protein